MLIFAFSHSAFKVTMGALKEYLILLVSIMSAVLHKTQYFFGLK